MRLLLLCRSYLIGGSARGKLPRSFQLGLASAPIAPQTVQTIRGPKDGTARSSANALASRIA